MEHEGVWSAIVLALLLGVGAGFIYGGIWLVNTIDRALTGPARTSKRSRGYLEHEPEPSEADAIAFDVEEREAIARNERAIAAWRSALATGPDLTRKQPEALH